MRSYKHLQQQHPVSKLKKRLWLARDLSGLPTLEYGEDMLGHPKWTVLHAVTVIWAGLRALKFQFP